MGWQVEEDFSQTFLQATSRLKLSPACTLEEKVLLQDQTALWPYLSSSLWVQPSCYELMQETCTQELSSISRAWAAF